MNCSSLHELVENRRFETKWLLAPTLRTGHQWIEALVRSGQPILNLRPTTSLRLAIDIAASQNQARQLTVVSSWLRSLAIDAAWEQLPANGHFGRLPRSTALTKMVSNSIIALRLADVDVTTLSDSNIDSAAKLADLRICHQAYCEFLKSNKLVDEADIYRTAALALASLPNALESSATLIVPDNFRASGLQLAFLDAIPAEQRVDLPLSMSSARPTSVSNEASGSAANDDEATSLDVEYFRAVGDVNQVREILRRCVSGGHSLDDVEVLVTDTESFFPLFYNASYRFESGGQPLPMTFADGLPACLSRPGRALIGWLAWITADYPQRILAELISNGLLNLSDSSSIGPEYCSRLLRQLSIGHGRANYVKAIASRIKSLKKQAAQIDPSHDEAEPTTERLLTQLNGLRTLRKTVSQLLKLAEQIEGADFEKVLSAAANFLTKSARASSELDNRAAERMLEEVDERREWMQQVGAAPNSVDWLESLPQQTRVMESGPQPGRLHVARLATGGQSGRRHTFVVGMDDRRFPGAMMQDAVLLDHERRAVSPQLELSGERIRAKIDDFHRTMSGLRGRLTLSWSSHDVTDDRETFPSPELLSWFRLRPGNADAGVTELSLAAGTPVSFAPDAPSKSLDTSEHWLWFLTQTKAAGQLEQVHAQFPNLEVGMRARALRGFGPNNGLVPQAGRDLDPLQATPPVYSASALEMFGRCPLAFFFRNGLRLYALDEVESAPDQWLDARQVGLLLHDVFRRFMTELAAAELRPNFERDHKRLAEILEQAVDQWRAESPPLNESSYRAQIWQLVGIARIFLIDEQEHCRNSQPRFFEVACGLESDVPTKLDEPQPVSVPLADGKRLLARGQIDRVDEIADGRFSIWDYKISSGYGYEADDPFRDGRRVQSVIYLTMIQSAVEAKIDPGSVVERFGYFFPSLRARGLRIDWSAEQLEAGRAILKTMASSIADGAFLATDDCKQDCTFCDYQPICGDVYELSRHSKRLLDANDLPVLGNIRGLRRG